MSLLVDIKQQENGFEGALVANKIKTKVDSIYGDKNNICFTVIMYKLDIAIASRSYKFIPKLEGDNLIRQAYEHLKTLEEFKDAIDV